MRYHVETYLLGLCLRLHSAAVQQGETLLPQLGHCAAARSGNRLIGVRHYASNGIGPAKGMGHHHQGGGGAIGNGNDALVGLHVRSIDFRNHQRNLWLHAKG